jgi:uncharacterized repeat protein (TIGR03803 family)
MQFLSPQRLILGPLSAALLTVFALPSHAADTYNPQTQQLLIHAVTVGGAIFHNMVIGVTPADIVVPPTGSTPFWSIDTYNPVNNELTIPTVNVGGATYFNVVVKVGSLISIGSVTGADTYNSAAGTVTIPEVQLGGVIYTNVVVTISSIQSHGGGMPKNTVDVYTPSSHQLAVAAVSAGGTVYTNVLVTPGTIKSVGGQLPVESTLYSFGVSNGADSIHPYGALLQGADGNFYGTALQGGENGFGTVFKMTAAGAESIVYSFGANASGDGKFPLAGLVQGSDGMLYGTTFSGGAVAAGTVFKVTPQGVESVLYSFAEGNDAVSPSSGLVLDAAGNLYGTTLGGGTHGWGTVYKVTPRGTESVLWSFADVPDGSYPQSNLILGTDGNFYGTTGMGGTAGKGTAFRITPAGSLTILHSFGVTAGDGISPLGGLTPSPNGNFYGTTDSGGAFSGSFAGTVFEMTPDGTVSILHSFPGPNTPTGADGSNPQGTLLLDGNGNLYGTTFDGGLYHSGILFKITPAGKEIILYTNGLAGAIAGNTDGNSIQSGLILGTEGNLYGIAPSGGANGTGVIFTLSGALTAY